MGACSYNLLVVSNSITNPNLVYSHFKHVKIFSFIKVGCVLTNRTSSRASVPNLWYAYPWGYAKIILVMAENTKKRVKMKTQKHVYEVLVYKERLK
jgi:hypothetical protein